MGEVTVNSQRITLLAALALVAAPVLAGCAENNGNDPGTGTTPTGTTPTGTTPPPSPSPTPTATPTVPTVPSTVNLNLKLGVMMPITGALSALGPDMRDGARMAVDEINAAKLGLNVQSFVEDDKTTDSAAAPNTFNRLVGQGVTAIAGPCCSGVTAAILDLAVQNEVVVASPSATSPALTERNNEGFFWRVAPSEAVQGKVLAQLVKGENVTSASLIVVNNAYGTGLAKVFRESFTAAGGTIAREEKYNEGANEFSGAVTAVCGGTAPQGLVLVAYIDEGANILKELNRQGCLSKFKIFGSEGVYRGNGAEGLPMKAGQTSGGQWLAAGVKGTNPESGNLSAYNAKFNAKYGHQPAQYSAESYDAVMYVALAAIAGKSTDGRAIADNLPKVANGGTKCNTFQTCATLLLAGQDIDYQGAAHDFTYEADGEPATGIYSWWRVNNDGQVETYATGKTA